MQKGERVDPFLTKLQETRDKLSAVGSTPQDPELVRLALNSVSQMSGKSLSRVSWAGRLCLTGMECG